MCQSRQDMVNLTIICIISYLKDDRDDDGANYEYGNVDDDHDGIQNE